AIDNLALRGAELRFRLDVLHRDVEYRKYALSERTCHGRHARGRCGRTERAADGGETPHESWFDSRGRVLAWRAGVCHRGSLPPPRLPAASRHGRDRTCHLSLASRAL